MTAVVHAYHDGTKHHFHRFARSLGYLDWASQPDPFRNFAGAPPYLLPPNPDAAASPLPLGVILRHALGLTAWKQFRGSRWSLRANPSSGNLHPTEAYLVCGPAEGLAATCGVYHYAAQRHALELRCAFEADLPGDEALVALTSIHWRESWKYGERAFRYCQHDLGHAMAAVAVAARLAGWDATLLPEWSHAQIAALTGIDHDEDYVDAEREEPGVVMLVSSRQAQSAVSSPVDSQQSQPAVSVADARTSLLAAVHVGRWTGKANQLSEEHVQWTFIDEIALATRDPGREFSPLAAPALHAPTYPADLLIQRRSALAFDAQSSIPADRFFQMLQRVMPEESPIFNALWWTPRIHLLLFVHRVDGIDPGLYLLPREPASGERLRAAIRRAFPFESMTAPVPLICLARGDCRTLARRVSCDQDIAADGFFSLGMIADFDASLEEFGDSFYRHLFWESGYVGQILYLEAEAAGARATGIGCFYDDPVHDVLGLSGHAFQSLYHFTVGIPVEDTRLTTEPGYAWEKSARKGPD